MKARSPLFTELHNGLNTLDIRTRRNGTIELGLKREPENPQTESQQKWRAKYGKAVGAWRVLSEEDKEEYRIKGKLLGLPAYQVFMQEALLASEALPGYKVSISNPGNALTDFQVNLTVSGDEEWFSLFQDSSKVLVVADDRETPLAFYIESWDAVAKNASIWIKIPTLAGSGTTYAYVLYDSKQAVSPSDPTSVFDFFDHMNSSSNWTVVRVGGSGYCTWQNSYVKMKSTSGETVTKTPVSLSNCWIEAWVYADIANNKVDIQATNGTYDSSGVPQNGYAVGWNGWRGYSTMTRIRRYSNYSEMMIAYTTWYELAGGSHYLLRMRWLGNNISMYNGTELLCSATDSTYNLLSSLAICVGSDGTFYSAWNTDWIRVRKACSQTITVSYEKV